MRLDILDVISTANKKKQLSVTTDREDFLYAGVSYPITGIKPFNLCLTNENNKKLLILGDTTLEIVLPCDRCLTDVTESFSIHINRTFPLEGGHVVCDEDEEIAFPEETTLDVDRLIYDEILVNWPTKVLCKDDCKGLCPVCGQNLNRQDCGCDRQVIDPRMAKFQDIFNEFKEV
jgi:uncharacterized protein